MGTLFRYLADNVLPLADTQDVCTGCNANATAFEIDAIFDPGSDYGEHSLCNSCLRSIPLRHLRPRDAERQAQSIINQHFKKGTLTGERRFNKAVDICDEIRRTPQILMFLQNEDWPDCCGEFAEFVGDSPVGNHDYSEYQCWDDEDSLAAQFQLQDFYPLEKMEVMNTMSLFHCLHCENKYWVFQYSGLFWPGPLHDGNGQAENA